MFKNFITHALFVTAAITGSVTPAMSASNDAAIYALIDSVAAIAAQIQLDGNAADWQGIPTFDDPAGDAGGDASRDIVSVAIAPRDNDLLVLIVTSGAPSAANLAFWLEIDFMPDHMRTGHMHRVIKDIELLLRPQGLQKLRIFEPGQPAVSTSINGVQMAIGNVIEILIPYAVLASVLPAAMATSLSGAGARPWLRVSVSSHNSTGSVVDLAPAVASYRLIPTPYPLDAPLIRPGTPPLSIEMPMEGKWFIWKGAFVLGTHENSWAYDLLVVDPMLQPSNPIGSNRNEDYYAWGQPVFAPASGQVVYTRNNVPDNTPPFGSADVTGNITGLDFGGNVWLHTTHLRPGSVVVQPGDLVAEGDLLARVGNSGRSDGLPHLHMHLFDSQSDQSLPTALSNVKVSLNWAADDPWTRQLDWWEPREQVFVESVDSSIPVAIWASAFLEGEVGVPFDASLLISGEVPPHDIGLTNGSLPTGLSLNPPTITGIPSEAKAFSFDVTLTDPFGFSKNKSFKIKILKALVISTNSLKAGKVGKKYRSTLKAKGGRKLFNWSIVSGSLPSGTILDATTGRISGTPTSVGSFVLTVQVTDSLGGVDQQQLTLTIN